MIAEVEDEPILPRRMMRHAAPTPRLADAHELMLSLGAGHEGVDLPARGMPNLRCCPAPASRPPRAAEALQTRRADAAVAAAASRAARMAVQIGRTHIQTGSG